jgi:hypothetical protein
MGEFAKEGPSLDLDDNIVNQIINNLAGEVISVRPDSVAGGK